MNVLEQNRETAVSTLNEQMLFKEAKQRERRRRIKWCAAVLLIAVVTSIVAALVGNPSHPTPGNAGVPSNPVDAQAASLTIPSCSTSNMSLDGGGGAAGTDYATIRLLSKTASCVAGNVIVKAFNTSTGRVVGPTLTSTDLKTVTIKQGKATYLPLGFADTPNYPVSRCHAAAITGVKIAFVGANASKWTYLRLPNGETVCTTRLSMVTQPYESVR